MSSIRVSSPAMTGITGLGDQWTCKNLVVLGLDWLEKKLGDTGSAIREFILDKVSLLILSLGSLIGILYCLLQTKNLRNQKKIMFLFGFSMYAVLGLAFHRALNARISRFFETFLTRFATLHILSRCAGILLVLVGFVYLTSFVEKDDGWNGYALGFYLFCYMHLITVMKLFGREDCLGASDSILAVTVTIYINLPAGKQGTWPGIFLFGASFILLLLKFSRPVSRNVEENSVELEEVKVVLQLGAGPEPELPLAAIRS